MAVCSPNRTAMILPPILSPPLTPEELRLAKIRRRKEVFNTIVHNTIVIALFLVAAVGGSLLLNWIDPCLRPLSALWGLCAGVLASGFIDF